MKQDISRDKKDVDNQVKAGQDYESKALGLNSNQQDITAAFDEFCHAFQEFKAANDERLKALENRGVVDCLSDDKVNRINKALNLQQKRLDDLTLKSVRPGFEPSRASYNSGHKAAFLDYMRTGELDQLKSTEIPLPVEAPTAMTTADSGVLVPEETESEILQRLTHQSPLRSIAGVRQVSSNTYRKPFSISGPMVGWAAETEARIETQPPVFSEIEYPTMELYAMPATTSAMLDDGLINVDEWIAEEVQAAFSEQETQAFVLGDGNKKPRGFLDYPTIDNDNWEWGNIGALNTGVAGGLPEADATDMLVDLMYSLKSGYRQNAHWVMNRRTLADIRKLKDADGNYIWQPSLTPDVKSSLMGFPVLELEDMPDLASEGAAIAYGDFSRGYLIVDRVGVRILRDPYSAKPYVLFYTTKRVGGGVQDFDAIKVLKAQA